MKKKSKKKSNENPRIKNQKNKAVTANVPDGWLYMSDTEMTAAAIKEALTDTAYQVEFWEAAQVLEITLGERSSMDVEVIEPCLGEANADAFLDKHQVKLLCYVTFPPEDFEAAKSVMEHICGRIGGFFCGDTEDFTPVIKGQEQISENESISNCQGGRTEVSGGMEMGKWREYIEFVPKDEVSAEIPKEIAVKYYICWPGEPREITPDNCREILKNLRDGQWGSIYLTNDPDLEEDFMQLESGNGLFFLQYLRDNSGMVGEEAAWFSTYDPEYLDSDEETDIECSDGQSIIFRKYATADKDSVMTAIEYFICTGKLWNGIQWMKSWRQLDKE